MKRREPGIGLQDIAAANIEGEMEISDPQPRRVLAPRPPKFNQAAIAARTSSVMSSTTIDKSSR